MASNNTLDPLGNLFESYMELLNNLTIKYNIKAAANETYDSMINADMFMACYEERDNYFSYNDYTVEELHAVNIYDPYIIKQVGLGNTSAVPEYDSKGNELPYRNSLLLNRRIHILSTYEDANDYYRTLNGYPKKTDSIHFYIPENIQNTYNLPPEILRIFDDEGRLVQKGIPVHKIQDYYNETYDAKIGSNYSTGLGDYYISLIEGCGILDKWIKANPKETYLNYIGSNRIHIIDARRGRNLALLLLKKGSIRQELYDTFIQTYEQCRMYFMSCLFNESFRQFFEYYDNFMAMSIFIMTIQQITMRQLDNITKRKFFDTNALKMFYETFDIPYNLYIDEESQNSIAQNINLLLQNKATNKVIYNIAEILGFSNIHLYKYYLTKNQKYNTWGVPKFETTERFNKDSGVVEETYDLESMFDVYFQRADLLESDIDTVYKGTLNKVPYQDITSEDPFWVDDENLYKMVWESEYNFVESKYLSLGIMYSMTEFIFDNVILLKLLLSQKDVLGSGESGSGLKMMLPRILKNTEVHFFDTIVLLLCLTAKSHNLYGDIIWEPTKIIAVQDYMETISDCEPIDTFAFNLDIFDEEKCGFIYTKTSAKRGPYLVVDQEYLDEMGLEFDPTHMKYISVVINDLPDVEVCDYVLLTTKFEYASEDSTGPFLIVDDDYLSEHGIEFDPTVMVYLDTVIEANELGDDKEHIPFSVGDYVLLENKLAVILRELYEVLDYNDFVEARKYINSFKISSELDNTAKLNQFNTIYKNSKLFYKLLLKGIEKTRDPEEYRVLKRIYDSAYYSKTMKEIFSITGEVSGNKRVAWSFFEFLYYLNPTLYNAVFEAKREQQFSDFKENGGYYVIKNEDTGEYEYGGVPSDFNDFILRSELTTLRNADGSMYRIDYSNMLNEMDETTSQKNELVYYYVNHICSRLVLKIDVKSPSLIGNNQMSMEDILLKLVRFFKSYTVDLISLNAIYVIDLKHDNFIKLIDHIPYIHKTSIPKDKLYLRYADAIKKLRARIRDKDDLKWDDKIALYGIHVIRDYIRPLYEQYESYINEMHLAEEENQVLDDWKLHNLMIIKGTLKYMDMKFVDFLRKADIKNKDNPIRLSRINDDLTEAYDIRGELINPLPNTVYTLDGMPYIWNTIKYEYGLLDSNGDIVALDTYLVDNNSVRLHAEVVGLYTKLLLDGGNTKLFDATKKISVTEAIKDRDFGLTDKVIILK